MKKLEKMKNHLSVIALTCICMLVSHPGRTQTTDLKVLDPGVSVPDLRMPMINFSADSLSLAQLRGKVVLLDFWSVWCAGCIYSFQFLADLQKQFKDSLFILPIGFDVSKVTPIRKFYAQRKGTAKEIKLPTALQYPEKNHELMAWFPFTSVPHYVWIDAQGRLIGTSKKKQVTVGNIRAAINGTLNLTN